MTTWWADGWPIGLRMGTMAQPEFKPDSEVASERRPAPANRPPASDASGQAEPPSSRLFWFGAQFEVLLLGLAVGLANLFETPIHWRGSSISVEIALGALATLPLFGFLVWSVRTRFAPTRSILDFLDRAMLPRVASWSLAQLAAVSVLAGVGEEALFRGVLQPLAGRWLGPAVGLLLVSLLFGLVHAVNRAYLLVTTIMGLYLGGLYLGRESLLAPITCHALYDLLALTYLLGIRARTVSSCRPPHSEPGNTTSTPL